MVPGPEVAHALGIGMNRVRQIAPMNQIGADRMAPVRPC